MFRAANKDKFKTQTAKSAPNLVKVAGNDLNFTTF